jgi:hypothetical protein
VKLRTTTAALSAPQRSTMDTSDKRFTLDNHERPIWIVHFSVSSPGRKYASERKNSVQIRREGCAIVINLFRLLPKITVWSHFLGGVRVRSSNRVRNGRCCRTLEGGEPDILFRLFRRQRNGAIRRRACGNCGRCHAGRVPGNFNHISRVDSQRVRPTQESKSPPCTSSNQK